MSPELLAKRKLQLALAARHAERKAAVLHAAAVRAKAAAKAARKSSKLARKAAKKAAKKARQTGKELKAFLKSAKAVRPPSRPAKPVAVRPRQPKAVARVRARVAVAPVRSAAPSSSLADSAGQ